MKITSGLNVDGTYEVRNKGRLIATYLNWADWNRALDTLDHLQNQLDRAEAFYDCQDIYPKGKR
jgi:hypothetical protein